MIPAWYSFAGMATAGLLGAVATHLAGNGRRAKLLKRTVRQVAELRRLTVAPAPARHRLTPVAEDRWSLPVSPRLTDRDRIAAAKEAAVDLPVQHGTIAENARRQELVRHAAPVPDANFYRNEHRIYSWGWLVEVVQRLGSVGTTYVWKPEEHPLPTPRHAAWNYDTAALNQFVAEATAEETRRRDDEFDALLYAMVAKGAVLR